MNDKEIKVNYNREFKVIIENRNSIRINRTNKPEIPGDVRLDTLTERTIKIFIKWLAAAEDNEELIKPSKQIKIGREELVVLGSHLFNVLFDDTTKKEFKNEYERIRNQQYSGLRVVLEFKQDARDLAVLPWEYIYYPDNPHEGGRGFFIATDNQLILARHVPLKTTRCLGPDPKPLRILIVVSKPVKDTDGSDLGMVNEKPVIETIKGLKKILQDAIQIDELSQPTKNDLTQKIQQTRPHVLHFIGHGKYDKAEECGKLALVKKEDPKIASWIKDEDLADCFRKNEPRLVFLHACEGARSESYTVFSGVALKLVYSNVPAVVAMQYEVTNQVANRFANKFYMSLGEGNPIDVAVQEGRSELGMFLDEEQNYSNRAFGSPVVYLQSSNNIIIAEAPPEIIDMPKIDKVSKVPCPYPDCSGMIIPGSKICVQCEGRLMQCPQGHVMAEKYGICHMCGYKKIGGVEVVQPIAGTPKPIDSVVLVDK